MRNRLLVILLICAVSAGISACKSEKADIPEEEIKRIESIDTDNAMEEAERLMKEIDKL